LSFSITPGIITLSGFMAFVVRDNSGTAGKFGGGGESVHAAQRMRSRFMWPTRIVMIGSPGSIDNPQYPHNVCVIARIQVLIYFVQS
jgi:hypothetical protein